MATLETAQAIDASSAAQRADAALRRDRPPAGAPLLEPASGGWAEAFSRRVAPEGPIRVFLSAVVLGYTGLVALVVAAGLMLNELLLSIDGLAARDESINQWLADHRNPTLEDLSWIGSTLAGGHVIPVLVGVLLVTFLALRRWRLAAFVLFVISVESGAYRATTFFVHRDRPAVERLEGLPVEASYPSGHTAASLALYGGLLLLLASRVRRAEVTVIACALLVAIPVFVAWARMYRGMHHLTDSVAGLLLGVGALGVTIFAARAAGAAADRRDGRGSTDKTGVAR